MSRFMSCWPVGSLTGAYVSRLTSNVLSGLCEDGA